MSQRPIDPAHVPPELHFLIPYAEKWGVSDIKLLTSRLYLASNAELEELNTVVLPIQKKIMEAVNAPPLEATQEAQKFAALRIAGFGAKSILDELSSRNQPSELKTDEYYDFFDSARERLNKRRLKAMARPTQFPNHKLDPAYVPLDLRFLIPLIERWEVRYKEPPYALLYEATLSELEALDRVVHPVLNDIHRFSLSKPTADEPGGYEAGVFDALSDTWREAGHILYEEMPREQWLKLVGWPEEFAPFPFDPSKVPAEFRPLAPYIEKWVREDDFVRVSALEVAPTAELEEFVAAVNHVGWRLISILAGELFEAETAKDEGVALLILSEMVEKAEWELKERESATSLDYGDSN
jgi:hypothetical protein